MMVTNAFQTRNSVGLNKPVYCRMLASASSGKMKNRRPASEREQPGHYVQLRLRERPGHYVQLRLREIPLCLREDLLDLLEQSWPRLL
jgi:hypothetical protein